MASNEHPNVTLLREGMDALERGDIAWFDRHIADDVIWHVGGNNKMSGPHTGKVEVLGMMGRLMERTGETFGGDLHDVLASDDHTVILGTAHGTTPSGEAFQYKFVNIFHIRDGQVVEAWGMSEDDSATDPIFDQLAQ